MEIVGMRVLDVGLCSDRCKLYEEVGPYGNWWVQSLQGVRERRGVEWDVCGDGVIQKRWMIKEVW